MRNPMRNMDHWGHFGGYIAGIAGAEGLLWQARRNKRNEIPDPESLSVPMTLQTAPTA